MEERRIEMIELNNKISDLVSHIYKREDNIDKLKIKINEIYNLLSSDYGRKGIIPSMRTLKININFLWGSIGAIFLVLIKLIFNK